MPTPLIDADFVASDAKPDFPQPVPAAEPTEDKIEAQAKDPWFAALSPEFKERFVTENGRHFYTFTHEDGRTEKHPCDNFDDYVKVMTKKGDNANAFIDNIVREQRELRDSLSQLKGEKVAWEKMQQARPETQAPAPPLVAGEPDWNATLQSLVKDFKEQGFEGEEALNHARAWLRVEQQDYEIKQLKERDKQRESQVHEMLGAVQGYMQINELKASNPLLKDLSLKDPEIVQLFKSNPGARPEDLIALHYGRKLLSGKFQAGGAPSPAPTKRATEQEIFDAVRRQMTGQLAGGQPVGGAGDAGAGGNIITDEMRQFAASMGNPTDDASLRKIYG